MEPSSDLDVEGFPEVGEVVYQVSPAKSGLMRCPSWGLVLGVDFRADRLLDGFRACS